MTNTPDVHKEQPPRRRVGWLRAHAVPAVLATLALPAILYGAYVTAEPAAEPATATPPGTQGTQADYMRLLRALRPKMTIEITQDNLNAYLRQHPEEFHIPSNFEDPKVTFSNGQVEISARTKVLFLPTRVRVSMVPQIQNGRLALSVRRIHAGFIRIPASFHRGTADMIAGTINQSLEQNDVDLTGVEVDRGVVRVTAMMEPTSAPTPAAPATQ